MADLVELELLEREGELEVAGRLAENAAGSSGALALVEGPAGVGKSSLLRKAIGLARERGFETANARASELERDVLFVVAGAGALLMWLVAAIALRHAWSDRAVETPARALRPALAES